MSHDDVVQSKANVPFSWEHKPGVSKVTHQEVRPVDTWHFRLKLPPPPRASKSTRFPSDDNLQALSTSSSSFKKGIRIQEDPFLRAYKKCTRSPINGRLTRDGKADRGMPKTVRKNAGSSLSCKYSCPVAGDNLVRMSQFSTPISKSEGTGKGQLLVRPFASQ
ncbi:T22J18.15-RELATED [Salix purpurea]|uniref:T22J18.15-RELATED n=1 Tax=Salix purpurea TaxID=77065 RepID=A0A9Q0NZW5_SALPP|nr:T22J18.15-RELATED [Salix purpurea]